MKIDPNHLTRVLEQNYSDLISDFLEMQTEYLASLNIIYHDLDATLIAMVLSSQFYKEIINQDKPTDKISLKNFYQKDSFNFSCKSYKINEISSIVNLPRETVRRKKQKLIKDKLIIFDKKKKYTH